MRRRHALQPLRNDALGIMCDKCRFESGQGLIDFQTNGSLWSPPVCRRPFSAVPCGRTSLYSAPCAGERSSELERQAEAVDCRHVVTPSRMLAATPGAVCSSQRRDCETAARLCQHPKHLIARDHCKTEVRTGLQSYIYS